MRPSELKYRVVFQRRLDQKDSSGQRLLCWVDVLAGLTTGSPKAIASAAASGSLTVLQCAAHGFAEGQLVTLTGVLPQPVTVGVLTPAADSFSAALETGGLALSLSTPTATPVSGLPASIEALSSRERINAQAVDGELTHRLIVRNHAALSNVLRVADFRALHVRGALSRYFVLQPAIERGVRDHYLEIPASEGPLAR